jgi:ParB-like nuclease domain
MSMKHQTRVEKKKQASGRSSRPDKGERPRGGHSRGASDLAGPGASGGEAGGGITAAEVRPAPQTYVTVSGRMWRIHPLASLMPWMADAEYERFKESIRARGKLRLPIIVTPEGDVLDGRHRLRACVELGIEPAATVCEDGEPYVDVVLDSNDKRRHLNPNQRALVAARLATLGPGRPGENAPIGAFTQCEVAEKLGVSRTRVQAARRLISRGCPELIKLVEENKLAIAVVARIADLDHVEQRRLAKQGPRSICERAAALPPRVAPKGKGRVRVHLAGPQVEPDGEAGGAQVPRNRPDLIAVGESVDSSGRDGPGAEAGVASSAEPVAPAGPGPSRGRGRASRPEEPAGPGDRRGDGRAPADGDAGTSRGPDAGDRPAPGGPESRSSGPADGDPAGAGASRRRHPYRRVVRRLARRVQDPSTLEIEAWIWTVMRPAVEKIRRAEAEDPEVRRFLSSNPYSPVDTLPMALAILKKVPDLGAWIPCRGCRSNPGRPQSECLICDGKGYENIPAF